MLSPALQNKIGRLGRLPSFHGFFLYALLAVGTVCNPDIHVHAAPNVPLNFDGWVTEALAKLETDGITGGFHRHTAPLSRADVAKVIQQAEARIKSGIVVPSEIDRKLLEKLKREFRAELTHQTRRATSFLPQLRATMDVGVTNPSHKVAPALESAFVYQGYKPLPQDGKTRKSTAPWLTLYSEFEGDNFDRPLPEGKTAEQRVERWRGGYTGNFKRGYMQIVVAQGSRASASLFNNDGQLNLLVGRDSLFWGASPYTSVGISDNSPPFDLVKLSSTFGRLKATAFTAQLDATWYDDGSKRYLAKRYISGHRVDYQFNDRFEIGASEWVLYGGDAQTLEWKYANPITFYYALQYNAKADDNVMFAFDAAYRPIDGLRLYGEWLADDFQYVPGANDPHAVAWLCGVEWYPQRIGARHLGVHTEYVRVNRWAYTHLVPENQFTHFGDMIGHPISTDSDTFTFSVSYQFTQDVQAKFNAAVSRNGEGTVADRFYGEDFEALPFPTGVVERITEIGGQCSYRPRDAWNVSLRYTWEHVRNAAHRQGEVDMGHRFAFQLGYIL